jgi:hypothetical protein
MVEQVVTSMSEMVEHVNTTEMKFSRWLLRFILLLSGVMTPCSLIGEGVTKKEN